MAENTPSTLYVGLLFGALLIVGFGMIQTDIYGNYGKDAENLTYLDTSDQVTQDAGDLKESIENTKPITGIDILDKFIAGTYNTLKLLFGVGDIYTTFTSDVGNALGVPATFIIIITTIIILTIIVAIISIITKMRV